MSYYSSQGYEIFIPVDVGRVDFIACKGKDVIKVQVKTASKRRYKDTEYTVGILTSSRGSGSKGCYKTWEIDECFIVDGTIAWRVPYKEVYPSISVMLASNKDTYKPKHGLPIDQWRVSL